MTNACDLIDNLLRRLGPEAEMRENWRALRGSGDLSTSADDPPWEGAPIVELSGSGTAYIRLYASVDWDRKCLHLTRQDWKTGGADASWDLPIEEATLAELRKAAWPEPGDRPWF